ncbi:MAG: hypothetical protein ABID64_04375 [Nitrospirota bacterium]
MKTNNAPSGIDESSIENENLPLGDYRVEVAFKKRNGEDFTLPFDDPVNLPEGETVEDLQKKAVSEASAVGLHNFGMDMYVGRYPEGHPVEFTLTHESGQEIKFIRVFDGNGYPR